MTLNSAQYLLILVIFKLYFQFGVRKDPSWSLGAVQLLRNAFLANFDPLVTKCHTGPNPLRNVTLVCRPDLKPVMLKKECIITSKIY